jgi:hypothetical protein
MTVSDFTATSSIVAIAQSARGIGAANMSQMG